METLLPKDYGADRENRQIAPPRRATVTYANVVYLHWLAAPGYYLVLAPSTPMTKHGSPRTRYIGPVSNLVAAEILKVSALAFGLADRAFQQPQ